MRNKDLFIEQQERDYIANSLFLSSDVWEEEQRILKNNKPVPIGIRIFSRIFKRKRKENINFDTNKLPF